MFVRISVRDIALVRNKYLIVASDAFLLQYNAFKRTVRVCMTECTAIVMKKDTMGQALLF